ncbi:M4 family metallopeptidase [Parapedobacter sp. 10938]|uniref:M4 family metallopeptidase n=1 Tax=Parapedobacter flavus TaxID=3110225 RepID=UPI002DBC2613|nr:M4 family metallopeptidase [Parapedobacter sp. 10938]MEC3878756.1 M4 family metallopeptidase [Parapedobacter sp. 10938]
MKRIIVTLLALLFACWVFAQESMVVIDSTSNGIVKFVVIPENSKLSEVQDSKIFLKQLLKASKETDFILYKSTVDRMGRTHEKYQQYYKGIVVEFQEYIIHRDKDKRLYAANGDFSPVPASFDIVPRLTFENAIETFIKSEDINKYEIGEIKPGLLAFNQKELRPYEIVIIERGDDVFHLCYKVNMASDNTRGDYLAYIDCHSGQKVYTHPLIMDANSPGTANTRYSGTRNIIGDSFTGGFRLREGSRNGTTSINTLNYQQAPAYYVSDFTTNLPNAVDFVDNNNNWTDGEHNNANMDDAALDVHWGAEMTIDYFNSIHNRNSYDDNGGTITNYVHVRTRNPNNPSVIVDMDNAFWSSTYSAMFYGDGLFFGPTVSLDVIAHEIGHGVCNTSIGSTGTGLVYEKEPGALNESLSDIWAACVEQHSTTGKQTWLLGEDIVGAGGAFRSMIDPNDSNQPDTYTGTFWFNTTGCIPDENNDNCGVHVNSGVGNFWFYLLVNGGSGTNDITSSYSVTGINVTDASRIVYRAETNYLTPTSNYSDMRVATIQATVDLFGDK